MARKPSQLPLPLRKLQSFKTETTDELVAALKKARRDIAAKIALAASNAKAAGSSKTRDELYAEIGARYATLQEGIDAQLAALTSAAAKAGHETALGEISAAGAEAFTKYDPERNKRYFDLIRPANGKSLAAVFTESMTGSAVRALRTATVDALRLAQVEGLTANQTQKALQERWDKLAGDEGAFRFQDKSGRAWDNARYLQMLVQTTAQRVSVESHIDTLAANGSKFGRISNDGDSDCPICAAWEGRIILTVGVNKNWPTYEDAKVAGVFHPNCNHRLEYVDPKADAAELDRQRKAGVPDGGFTIEAMQAQKDNLDFERFKADGMTPADAARAVTADRLEKAIRLGTLSDSAAAAVKMMAPADLDAIRAAGIPSFQLVKDKKAAGYNKGVGGGIVRIERTATAQDVLNAMGIKPPAPAAPVAPLPAKPAPAPVKKPEPKKEAPPPPPPKPINPFPETLDGLETVKSLGGSTGAKLVRDPDGRLFVMKKGGTPGHVENELAVDNAYRAAGVAVPEGRLFKTANGPVKLTKYLPDAVSLGDYLASATPEQKKNCISQLEASYHVDAILGNLDVIGLGADNVMVDKAGKVWRIDNGGALGFRAQGQPKDYGDWGEGPAELFSLCRWQKKYFPNMNGRRASVAVLAQNWEPVIAALPEADGELVRIRVREAALHHDRAVRFIRDGFTDEHADAVGEFGAKLVSWGAHYLLPAEVKNDSYSFEFGKLRTGGGTPSSKAKVSAPDIDADVAEWASAIKAAGMSLNHHVSKGSTDYNKDKVAKMQAAVSELKAKAASGSAPAKYLLEYAAKVEKGLKDGTAVEFFQDESIKNPPPPQQAASKQKTGATAEAAANARKAEALKRFTSYTDLKWKLMKSLNGSDPDFKAADPEYTSDYMGAQGGNSWNPKAVAMKAVILNSCTRPENKTWFNSARCKDAKAAQKTLESGVGWKKDVAMCTMKIEHAAVQLFLERTAFKNRDPESKTVRLMRTENVEDVVKPYKLKHGKLEPEGYPIGMCESNSFIKPVAIMGAFEWTTIRNVPFSRIWGSFMMEGTPGSASTGYLSDGEQEFDADLRGLPAVPVDLATRKYKGHGKSKEFDGWDLDGIEKACSVLPKPSKAPLTAGAER